MQDAYVFAGQQSDFSVNWQKTSTRLMDLLPQIVYETMEKSGLSVKQLGSVHIGNFIGELSLGQGLLGGVLAEAVPELRGLPIGRHEGACASGSLAILGAIKDVASGFTPLSLVVGIEQVRHLSGKLGAAHLGTASWQGEEAKEASYPWPYLFNEIQQHYRQLYGVEHKHLAAISRTNFVNARRNQNAQTRTWKFDKASFQEDDQANPVVEGQIRRQDCGQMTDGVVALLIGSSQHLEAAKSPAAKISGYGCRTDGISIKRKLQNKGPGYLFPHLNGAIKDAFAMAKMEDVWQLDTIETHDCFAISQYIAIDHFGITKAGEAWKAIEAGWHDFDGRLPINPSGGLIGCGHPVGATGVRMALDTYKQVTGQAGDYQVEGAKTAAFLNIGGSFTTSVAMILSERV